MENLNIRRFYLIPTTCNCDLNGNEAMLISTYTVILLFISTFKVLIANYLPTDVSQVF